MSMKSSNAPRRAYVRNGIVHVCFAGKTFGKPSAESAIKASVTKLCKIVEREDGSIDITQRAPKKKGVTETWAPIDVPSTPRA